MRNGTQTKPLARGLAGAGKLSPDPRPVPCQICGAITAPGLDLGPQPIGDRVLFGSELNQPETLYPLQLHHCPQCGLTQLGYIAPPRAVYKRFPFVSGTTKTATKHLQSLPKTLVKNFGLDRKAFALDIGSNDGTLLKGYLPYGVRFLGVDPAGDPVRIANRQGLETLHTFFNAETAEFVREQYGKADAITACGVFGHIADLAGLMKGVRFLLGKRGVFATDNQYWFDTMRRLHYDNMFHQHLRYYSMKPLIELHRQYGLDVFDVERSEVYGGSIRVFACHQGEYPMSRRLKQLVALEEREQLHDPKTHAWFIRKVEEKRRKLFDAVYRHNKKGRKVIGIGAPAKASTVCNYCDLGPDRIACITEVNPLRVGKYLPGVHIPIVDEEEMFRDRRPADAAILFAWNYYNEVVPKLRQRGFKGEVLLP